MNCAVSKEEHILKQGVVRGLDWLERLRLSKCMWGALWVHSGVKSQYDTTESNPLTLTDMSMQCHPLKAVTMTVGSNCSQVSSTAPHLDFKKYISSGMKALLPALVASTLSCIGQHSVYNGIMQLC